MFFAHLFAHKTLPACSPLMPCRPKIRQQLTGILLGCLCLFSGTSQAATYCVDPNGTGEQGCDYMLQTVAEVNGLSNAVLLPGDRILFKRGETWRETLLVPVSGEAGSPVTIGAYGTATDPRPVISCANDVTYTLWEGVIANGGFEQAVTDQGSTSFPGWTSGGSAGYVLEQVPGNGSPNSARILSVPGGSASIQTVEWHMEPGVEYTISGSVRAVTPGTTVKVLFYTLNTPAQHLDASGVWQDSSVTGRQPFVITTESQWQSFNKTFTGIDGSRTFFRVDITGTNAEVLIDDFKITKTGANYWSVPRGSVAPNILIEDGVRLASGPEWDENFRWHRVGGASALTRYILPEGTVPADHLVEIGERRTGIGLFSKNYIEIRDIIVEGCEPHLGASLVQGAGILMVSGSSHNTVDNVLSINNDNGIRVEGAGPAGELNTGNVFKNFEVANSITQGIALRSYATVNKISNCIVRDLNMLSSDDTSGDKEAISIGGNTGNGPGNVIEHCHVYNVGADAAVGGAGINVFNSPQTTIRYNTIHDIGRIGIGTGANNASPNGWNLDDIEIYGNLVLRTGLSASLNAGQGIAVSASDYGDITGVNIYNNTVADCELHDNKDGGISLRGVKNIDNSINAISNIEIRNNIVSGCHGTYPHALFVGSTSIVDVQNLVSDNNLFFPASTVTSTQPFISYKGTNYKTSEFALYQQVQGQDGNSIMADPQFANPAADDFHLSQESPAREGGADVGLTQDLDGNLIAGLPDIGAFEFVDVYMLTLNTAGTGTGTVTGGDTYNHGTTATVTATASEGSAFDGWTGPDAAECETGSIAMTGDKSCTATFTLLTFQNPSAQAAQAGGDGNGYQTNPVNVYAYDAAVAVDTNSGTNTNTSCSNSGKDKHRFYNYGFTIPAGATIKGIEVKLNAKVDNTKGSPKICVQLSSDGGSTWTTAQATATLTTALNDYILGGPADTWGHVWNVTNLSNADFRVRVINVASNTSRDFSLNNVAVKVTY